MREREEAGERQMREWERQIECKKERMEGRDR